MATIAARPLPYNPATPPSYRTLPARPGQTVKAVPLATGFAGAAGAQAFQAWLKKVSGTTGISETVLAAWVLAENGSPAKTDPLNPLNIKWPGSAPANSAESAKRTSDLLLTARYAPVILAARVSDTATVDAITRSPWDACNYRGTNPDGTCTGSAPGTLLRGTYERVKAASPSSGGGGWHWGNLWKDRWPWEDPSKPLPDRPGAATADAVTGIPAAIDRAVSWAEGAGLRALGYLTLTALAVGLFLLALVRLTGLGPPALAALRGGGRNRPVDQGGRGDFPKGF